MTEELKKVADYSFGGFSKKFSACGANLKQAHSPCFFEIIHYLNYHV